ncbi:undecaprenyl diphosphate synthase [Balneicella halophila]|uniref:Isoprenyl transferase n=1 Tax=Balneicella halophila TaxID=1537566 RepID=A0A7L4URI2_BALHA|nr:isoprenyl transferase [Balneicella halophila]PVX52350.1 undecaprenyl diphosphate synthase [Balneicella halophila]
MQIDEKNIPKHIAIIMDGNGRWAKKHLLPRALGHREGVKAVERTLEAAGKLGVRYLTLYAFSTENWGRPQEEVKALMELLARALEKYEAKLKRNNVSLRVIGDYRQFPESLVNKIDDVIESTSTNTGITLIIALNYSGRWEITHAMQRIGQQIMEEKIQVNDINSELIEKSLTTNFAPDPDLIIRTSGEHRVSNFLLWQCAYSEFYFTPKLWPEFDEKSLKMAIIDYQQRERRFGGLKTNNK